MKVMLILLDGIADRPVKGFGSRTPLEYAGTPNLDRLASMGITGQMDVLSRGISLQ